MQAGNLIVRWSYQSRIGTNVACACARGYSFSVPFYHEIANVLHQRCRSDDEASIRLVRDKERQSDRNVWLEGAPLLAENVRKPGWLATKDATVVSYRHPLAPATLTVISDHLGCFSAPAHGAIHQPLTATQQTIVNVAVVVAYLSGIPSSFRSPASPPLVWLLRQLRHYHMGLGQR